MPDFLKGSCKLALKCSKGHADVQLPEVPGPVNPVLHGEQDVLQEEHFSSEALALDEQMQQETQEENQASMFLLERICAAKKHAEEQIHGSPNKAARTDSGSVERSPLQSSRLQLS